MNFDEKEVIDRIRQLRIQHSGLRGKSSFAKELGLSASTYNYYEQDRLAPLPVLVKISELTGVDIGWIIKGHQRQASQVASGQDLRILERIWRLAKKDVHVTSAVVALLDLLEESHGIGKVVDSGFSKMVPVLGRTAAGMVGLWSETALEEPAGIVTELADIVEKYTGSQIHSLGVCDASVEQSGANLVDLSGGSQARLVRVDDGRGCQISEFLDCYQIKSAYPDAFGLWIDGDSMAPRINDGQIVILSPSFPAVNGQIAVVKVKDQIGVTCKIYRLNQDKVHLIPINERYETKILDCDRILWALGVICKINM